jgi:uncharacterized membrane protein HdeD (DUF308 family)
MVLKKSDVVVYFSDMPKNRKYWGRFFILGLLLIILGLLAIGYAGWATEFTVILLGFLLAAGGLLQLISSSFSKQWTGFSYSFLMGLFYTFVGFLCIFKPVQSAEGLTLLIAAVLLIGGSFRAVSALSHRFDYWGLVVFSGLISIGLGILILAEWPSSSFWVIGVFVGVDLLLAGWAWVLLSLAARKS